MTTSIVRRNFIFPLFSLGALMSASACILPGGAAPVEPAPVAEGAAPGVTGPDIDRVRMISPLAGGDWIIQSIGGQAVNDTRPPTIAFGEDGRVSGYGGCNRFNGGYTQDGAKVTFTPVMMTMMACVPDASNRQESALGAVLTGTATQVISVDGTLVLTGANGTEVTAKRAATFPVLAGTNWTVDAMGGVGLVSGNEPTISFTEDGRIKGGTGCNLFLGGYEQDGAKLTFTGTGATKMACMGDGVMAQESAFLAILGGAAEATYGAGPSLTIRGANGVSFTALPAPLVEVAGDPAMLQGAEWVVEDISRTGVIDNSRLTLAFGADARVSGSDNCNRFNGTYTADGSKLTLSPLNSTRRACSGEALANQAQKYKAALSGDLNWSFTDDGALLLTGDEDSRVLLRR